MNPATKLSELERWQLQPGDEVKFIEEMAAEGPQARRVSVGQHHIPI